MWYLEARRGPKRYLSLDSLTGLWEYQGGLTDLNESIRSATLEKPQRSGTLTLGLDGRLELVVIPRPLTLDVILVSPWREFQKRHG